MRRPNICSNSVSVADETYKPSLQSHNKEEGRVGLVRRVLTGSRLKKDPSGGGSVSSSCSGTGLNGGPTTTSCLIHHNIHLFGTPLTDLPLTNSSVPRVLHRLCLYIELHGMKIEGLFRVSGGDMALVEQLKVQFDKEGDARLESCGDISAVALLLLMWLQDLPEPLLSSELTEDLIALMHKYGEESWWGPVCLESILSSGVVHSSSLEALLHLLHGYSSKNPATLQYIPSVFCPLITGAALDHGGHISSPQALHLTTKLIQDYRLIFKDRNFEVDVEYMKKIDSDRQTTLVSSEIIKASLTGHQQQRKRKDTQDSEGLERKFVRSNSEERPSATCGHGGDPVLSEGRTCVNMRRVSSHEDFSKTRNHQNINGNINHHLTKNSSEANQFKKVTLPLQERNSCSPQRQHPQESIHLMSTVGYTSDLYDENEHERRRNSERFAPQRQRHRNGNRPRPRRPRHHHYFSQAKENESDSSLQKMAGYNKSENKQQKSALLNEESLQSIPSTALDFGASPEPSPLPHHRHNINEDEDLDDEEDQSPSPISGVDSPTLDLNTLQVHSLDPEQPIPCSLFNIHLPSDDRLVSPRNSLVISKRTYAAAPTLEDDPAVLDLTTQINNLKHKLRKYEDGFEKEFGFKPSHADKMANPDTKKMCAMLSKLKKQLKSTKEECSKIIGLDTCRPKREIKEEVVREIEKRLCEKRRSAGRQESLELMSPEEIVEEKGAMQKALLQLEASFGRPQSREEKDLVRSLYDRYRAVKRMLLRHAPSKLKESVTELGTILEHETMDFTSSPSSTPPRSFSPGPSQLAESPAGVEPSRTPEPVLDNLHSLPVHELLELQRKTREEKKKLRRNLREYEQEFQIKTGRKLQKEDRDPLDATYIDYKNVKAKLRFLDALIAKTKREEQPRRLNPEVKYPVWGKFKTSENNNELDIYSVYQTLKN